jgi:CxxC motif-containing protein (DUF1111 family)
MKANLKRSFMIGTIGLAGMGLGCSAAPIEGEDIDYEHLPAVVVDFSRPLAGLTAAQLDAFEVGEEDFAEVEEPDEGLGPIFNEAGCAVCHSRGGTGGGSTRVETRFGRTVNGVFDPLVAQGGSLIQDHSIGNTGVPAGCQWIGFDAVPANANTLAQRRTTPLFGLGFVDATPESTFAAIAAAQPTAVRGRMNRVLRIATKQTVMGKFGWKAQVPTLFQFSGDAYLNEMGITNPEFPTELCPNGNCSLMAACNPLKTLNDDGTAVVNFNNFMSMLAAPHRGTITATVTAGETVFRSIGCANCHTPTIRSGSHPIAALANKDYHPYSDFLLHDMGTSGDGIGGQGIARPAEMRTQPLWGLRTIQTFLHGGNAVLISEAIARHRGQANAAATAFNNLSSTQRSQILAFLNSL